ncbi:GNAT family N-acetyltransferase [Micromonospora sp. CA-249363]|uniref:GNAT family N-acetyltransferase n=1 Tax=Micromonospora sp. CA-249363 TaxID=3239963 RepID=UPI003D942A21
MIENVVVEESRRGTGLGRQIMAGTLQAAWDAGCYKAMLMTGRGTRRRTPSTGPAGSWPTSRRRTSRVRPARRGRSRVARRPAHGRSSAR